MRRISKARSRGANAKQVRALRSSKSHTRESPKTGDSLRRFESRQSRDMGVSMKHAVIVAGGMLEADFAALYLKQERPEYLIAADFGLEFMYQRQLRPDIVIGDFDSVAKEIVDYYRRDSRIRFFELNPVKDDTDTEAAVRIALHLGAGRITLLGVTGTRLDHVLANISLLLIGLQEHVPMTILDAHNRIRMLNQNIVLRKEEQYGDYVSLIPYMGDVTGVTLRGMKYPLTNHTFTGGNSLGISNEIVEEQAEILFSTGILLMIETRD